MTVKKIMITLAVAFIAALVIILLVVWQDNAGAQPPRFEEARPIFRGAEAPAICALALDGHNYVYVVKGDTIYQFDAINLKLMNKAPLEEERRFRPDKREAPFPPSRKR